MVEGEQHLEVNEQNKIYILGGKGVGKTSFFHLLFEGKLSNVKPSKPGVVVSNFHKGNKVFTIKDLTDDDNFSKTKILIDELEDVLLIFVLFAIDDRSSFKYAKNLIQFIKSNLINNKDLNIILVGNKQDIEENNPDKVQVKKTDVDHYIRDIENLYYKEISCKTNFNFSKLKELIENIEINEDNNEEDDDKIPEEERKKKVNDIKAGSCFIY